MLPVELILELENLLGVYEIDSEGMKKILAMRAKRFQKIRQKYPMGTPYIHKSGADIGKHGKAAFPTVPLQKKYEKGEKEKTRVTPKEKSALSKALSQIQKPAIAPERGKVLPFRARKAA